MLQRLYDVKSTSQLVVVQLECKKDNKLLKIEFPISRGTVRLPYKGTVRQYIRDLDSITPVPNFLTF